MAGCAAALGPTLEAVLTPAFFLASHIFRVEPLLVLHVTCPALGLDHLLPRQLVQPSGHTQPEESL